MATSGLLLNPSTLDFLPFEHLKQPFPPVEAIEIYLVRPNHSVTPLKVLSSDTIASVKMRIQASNGVFMKHQRLVYAGRELSRDDCFISEYGVRNGEVLHLVLRLSDLRIVIIKTANGTEYEFKLERTRSVRELKQRMSKKEAGDALDEQQLISRGENLSDERRIDDLPLEDDAVVHLFVRDSAKVRSKVLGREVELSVSAVDVPGQELRASSVSVIDEKCTKSKLGSLAAVHPKRRFANNLEIWHLDRNVTGICDVLPPELGLPRARVPSILLNLIQRVRAGLQQGRSPVLSSEGSGGAYFMQNEHGTDVVAVFKPMDEEPMAINNPRGLPPSPNGEGLKRGTRVGEGALREVAAYVLDHPVAGPRNANGMDLDGFAGVPPTIMVRCSHKAFHCTDDFSQIEKIGSLQSFVHAFSNCEDMGPAKFSVEEVHKICILDIRLANTDRNGGNILVCKQGEPAILKLVPIDHGYCLPDKFEDCTFEWMYWPQSRVPFQQVSLQYISSLDAEKDIALLRNHGWILPPKCARVLRVATMLLKKGAAIGLTPCEIGCMMSRETINRPSLIEKILEEAEGCVLPAFSEEAFMEVLSEILDHYIQKEKVKRLLHSHDSRN